MILGVDIGGTKIAAGLVDENAQVTKRIELPTRAQEGYAISRGQVDAAIGPLVNCGAIAIGICAPGPLNPLTGVVINPPNLPGWRDIKLAEEIAARFGLPCKVENDANAAALAETLFGAAKGCTTVFYATLSTGIGTGIIIDGKIFRGMNGAAAEGGHVSIDYRNEIVCECGLRGCIEALASGTAMARHARGMLAAYPQTSLQEPITAQSIGIAAALGDACALRAIDETTTMLAAWLGGMITLFDPEIVVLGGGVAQLGEMLFEPLRRKTASYSINPYAGAVPIVPAMLLRDSGIVGAAAVWL